MQKHDESMLEYMKRAIGWLEYNPDFLTEKLITVESVMEFFSLISDKYGVSLSEEMFEEILYNNADSQPYNEFIDKYNMPWNKIINGKFEEKY